MFNPFREHFWRHLWGPWSAPSFRVTRHEPDGDYGHMIQYRTCRACGKVETKRIY